MADYAAYRATQTGTRANNSQSASVLRQQKQQSRSSLFLNSSSKPSSNNADTSRLFNLRKLPFLAQKAEKKKTNDRSVVGVVSNISGNTMHIPDNVQSRISKGVHAAATPVRLGTSWLLQQAWLYAIASYGLTLIWINIHVFLRYVVGTAFFCKLGREWLSGGGGGLAKNVVSGGEKLLKTTTVVTKFNKIKVLNHIVEVPQKAIAIGEVALGLTESLVLLLVDLIVLFVILLIVTLIAFVVGIINHPVDFVGQAITS